MEFLYLPSGVLDLRNWPEGALVIAGRRTGAGIDRMRCWISGPRRSVPMNCATRARVLPSRRAMATCLAVSPDSRNDEGRPTFILREATAAG